MPQLAQIVPSYRHPHVMTVINDNTEFDDSVAPAEVATVRSFFVITSDKGRDGQFITFDNEVDFVREFGLPNFEKHGQPGYNAHAFLKQPDVAGYVMRVTADDATYSNIAIVAKVKVTEAEIDDEGEKTKDGKMEVYYAAYEIPDLRDTDDVEQSMKLLGSSTTEDEDGFLTFPLFATVAAGRGSYGDSLRTRLVRDFNADGENPFVNYRSEIYELDGYLRQREAVVGSLHYDAVDSGITYYLQDRYDDEKYTAGNALFFVAEDSITDLHELYHDAVKPNEEIPMGEFDFLFGLQKYDISQPVEGFEFVEHEDAVTLDSPDGIQLVGGDDGKFKYERDDSKLLEREQYINDRYLEAFAGKIDRAILSKRRTPSELFFDASYSHEIKRQIITLLLHRYDCLGHLDAGVITNITEAINYAEDEYSIGDRIYSREFQHYQMRDPFSGKRMTVTYTYRIAETLPEHIVRRGLDEPYATESRARLSGHIKNTLKPSVDADDSDIKEELYNNRMNYVETIADNVFVRGTQSTSLTGTTKSHWSDLNEEHNMRVLLAIKRDLEDYVARQTYNFAEEEDRAYFTEQADNLIDYNYSDMLHSYDVYFDMNEFEETRSILHCYLSVSFKAIAKRGIIEIDVNPRQ